MQTLWEETAKRAAAIRGELAALEERLAPVLRPTGELHEARPKIPRDGTPLRAAFQDLIDDLGQLHRKVEHLNHRIDL